MDANKGDIGVTCNSFASPLEHYRLLRVRLFDFQGEGNGSIPLKAHFASPFARKYQLSRALERLVAQHSPIAPLVPIQYPSGAAPLTDWWGNPDDQYPKVVENCQLALLWATLGKLEQNTVFQEAAQRLAAWLNPIVSSKLWTLWSSEGHYTEEEAMLSSALFLRALGKNPDLERPEIPFFAWLYDQNPTIHGSQPILEDASLGYRCYFDSFAPLAITGSGKKSGAGALRIGSWSIPAFGPQGDPLSDLNLFGLNSGGNAEGWFSSAAQPEAWFRVIPEKKEKGWILHVDSVGLSAHRPLAFAFYVKGDVCSVPGRNFKPGSLQKYLGEGQQVQIDLGQEKFFIVSDGVMKLEIVPLAGETGFWGASFLIAFWLPPFLGSYSFEIVAK